MTYRGSFPPGQAYNGQPQPPVADLPQYPNGGSQHLNVDPQYVHGLPQYGAGGPQYTNGGYIEMNQNAHYHNQQQYVQPGAYNQQPAQQYYAPNPPRLSQPLPPPQPSQPTYRPQQQFQTYDGTYDRPPPPPQSAPMPEFVNPSFLQQRPAPARTFQPPPPEPESTSRAVLQPVEPAPVPRQQYTQPVSVKQELHSPRVETLRTPSQIPRTKPTGSVTKRQNSAHSVARSPSVGHAAPPVDTLSLLICVAEDCFSKARQSVQEVGRSLHPDTVKEYHKLIATGLGCLDVALQSNKVWPRLEARIRLRYASMLVQETTNYMEAETTLMKGISLCEKVCSGSLGLEKLLTVCM